MSNRSATIYDVAEAANVSIATVSRVLNNSAHVRGDTRERVESAIKRLRFVPSSAARNLSGARRWSVGLVYPLEEDRPDGSPFRRDDEGVLYNDGIIRGASWQASQLGYSLFASALRIGDKRDSAPLQQLYSAVDGIILTDRVAHHIGAMRITKRMHAVHLSGSGKSKFGGTIRVDNAGGMSDVVEHLAHVHHVTRFGFVGGIIDSSDAQARRDAMNVAVSTYGGRLDDVDVINGEYSFAVAREAVSRRLQDSAPLPQVFVCANDQMALGAIEALRQHSLHVPQDILVTGFDNISLSRQASPSLTTIAQPSFELGVAAVKMVIGLLDGEVETGSTKVLPTTLMVRESCGCPVAG